MAPSPRMTRVAVIAEPIRKSVYRPGEWVWCEWKKIYYKAKILERGIENDGQYYNIHYWKFSKLWDMTVSEKKMFPVMDENNKWVKNHNKLMRKEIKEAKKSREKILSLSKKGLPPREMPPYLIIEKIDVSNYLDKFNTTNSNNEVSDGKLNNNYNGGASTSREDDMTEKHSDPINIDGNGHVNGSVLNTKASASVSFNNHDESEMNIKCENIVGPEIDITTDAGDQNVKEVNLSFHEAEANIKNKISLDSQKTNDKWFEGVQAGPELQSDDNSSELKHCNNLVSPQCEMGSNSIENEQHDHNEKDLKSTSYVKVPLHTEVEKNTYSSQNGSTQIFKRKSKNQTSAEREKKKKRRKRKHMIINNHVDLIDENRHIIKSNKLCSMNIMNKNNEKSIDGDDLAGKSIIDIQFSNMISPEGDSFTHNEGNELSTKEGVSLQIMSPTTIAESNNENKLINTDDSSSSAGGDLKIEEELKIEKDFKIEEDLKIEDLKFEEASTSSMTVTEANYENEMIKLVIGSPQDGDLKIEESSTISATVSEENDENLIGISCKSTKDDGEYADNMKVMNEVKMDDYEDNFFKQFGYDKPYSRIAKQRATEAISLMSKTVNKDKKNEGCKKSKITKKKDDDEPSNIVLLTHSNLNLNCYFLQIFIQDYHLVTDDRYMPIVPSKITVFDILSAYTKYSSANLEVFTQLIHVFDNVFESLLLYPIERPKHTEIVRKRPDVSMTHMYGLPHLARFIFYLPGILCTISYAHQFTSGAIHFMQGLTDYLEEQEMELSLDLYENTLPEYVRCSFLPYR